jgi:L-asparaginase
MQAKNQKIVVLGTGGTIAGESNSENEGFAYQAAQRSIHDLLQAVAGPSQTLPSHLEGFQIETEQICQIDSKDMSFPIWQTLALRCDHWLSQPDVHSVVITHGTDTLEETAYFLSQVVQRNKPIILTCAMRPANFKDADGPQNMRDALNAATQMSGDGVWLVAAGEIHNSLHVQKVHPTRINAFDSGERGPAALVRDDHILWQTDSYERAVQMNHLEGFNIQALTAPEEWPWVEIIMNHVQSTGRHIQLLVDAGVKGLVVAGTGNASVSQPMKEALLAAQSMGVKVCIASRCNQGPLMQTANHAFAISGELNPAKARVALILNLMSKKQSHFK